MVHAAGRRRVLALALHESALALAFVFSGTILMLLLGTQILAWYWLILLGGAGAGVALYRVVRSRMPPYRVAQVLDNKFELEDSLSTAWFLRSGANPREDSVARFQIARAEELAGSVRLSDAFPFRGHRAWAVAGALAAVAFGLFALRYMVTSSLSLRQSLIPLHLDSVFERSDDPHSLEGRRALHSSAGDPNAKLVPPEIRENAPGGDANEPQDGKQNRAESAASGSSPAQNAGAQAKKSAQESQSHEGGRPSSDAKSGDKPDGSTGQSPGSKTNPDTKDQSGQGQDASPGLMDKMKDALSSLMAKMRPSQNSQRSPQDDKRQNADGKTGNPNATNKDQAGEQQSAGNQQTGQQQNSQGQAQGQTKEQAQASQSEASDQSAETGSDSRSGVGRQDGNKGVKEAEQLQAMGKLEEIIGKRSANLTGEMSVETPSNKQQLKTAYSQRQGHHTDSGGEINRDEIPLIYQQYVREYMEQVRKQANSAQSQPGGPVSLSSPKTISSRAYPLR